MRDTPPGPVLPPPTLLRGIGLMMLASALVAGTTLMAKALGTGALGAPLHPLQISAGRFLSAFVALIAVAAVLRPRIRQPHLPLHLGRVLAGWLGVTCLFAASARIPLADATAITFLNPVVAMLLAIPLLGERVGPVRWLAAGGALVGALLILRPGAGVLEPGALIALCAALLIAFEVVAIKLLTAREGVLQILIVNNAMASVFAVAAAAFVWLPPTPAQAGLLVGISLVMVAAQACFLTAMRAGDASLIAPFFYATLVFAGAYDAALFGSRPDALSLAGAAVILISGAVLALREQRARQRAAAAAEP